MSFILELKLALRRLCKNPGFSIAAVLIFAIGIGLSVYIYSFLKVVLFQELEEANSDAVMMIEGQNRETGRKWCCGSIDPFVYQYISENQKSLVGVAAIKLFTWANVSSGKTAAVAWVAEVTESFFDVVGVQPIMGRTLISDDGFKGAPNVVVVGYDVWQEIYDGAENVIGKNMRIQGENYTIVGVMPEKFNYPIKHELWIPLQMAPFSGPVIGWSDRVSILGKLKPDVSQSQLDAELKTMMAQLQELYPESYESYTLAPWPLTRLGFVNANHLIYLLSVTAVSILLLVCSNIGNLLLARASENIREVAIKSALGAPRLRLMWQTLSESLILCVIGGLLGLVIAHLALITTQSSMNTLLSFPSPFWWQFGLRGDAAVFAVGVMTIAWLLAGIFPSWRVSGANCVNVLKDANKGGSTRGSLKFSGLVVCVQIAMSSVFVGLALDSSLELAGRMNVDYGVNPEQFVTGHIELLSVDFPTRDDRLGFLEEFHRQLEEQSGIVAAASATHLVGETNHNPFEFNLADKDLFSNDGYPTVSDIHVHHEYFHMLGIKPLSGRGFAETDNPEAPLVAVVTSMFAEKMWPNESALGKRIQLDPKNNGEWLTVVGVIPHLLQETPSGEESSVLALYRPFAQTLSEGDQVLKFMVKVTGDPEIYVPKIREAARHTNANVPIDAVWTLEYRIGLGLSSSKLFAKMFMTFGLLSLILAAGAIYSTTARAVVLRTGELGIRRALGASDMIIIKLLVGQGARRLGVGLLIGLVASLYLGIEWAYNDDLDIRKILADTFILFGGVSLVMALTVFAASYFPVRKAISIEPATVLQYD